MDNVVHLEPKPPRPPFVPIGEKVKSWAVERGTSQQESEEISELGTGLDQWLADNRNTSLLWAEPKDVKAYLWAHPHLSRDDVMPKLKLFCEGVIEIFELDDETAEVMRRALSEA